MALPELHPVELGPGSSVLQATARVAAAVVCLVRRATASSRDPTSARRLSGTPHGMRAAATLAFALRSSKADHGRKLGPVDGVEPSIAGMDRHQGSALSFVSEATWATSSP